GADPHPGRSALPLQPGQTIPRRPRGRHRPTGDLIGRAAPGAGQGPGAGDQPGEDVYEAEVSEEELAAIVFEGWELPDLKQKEPDQLPAERPVFDDIRKRGLMGNLDKKRTYLESLKRTLREGGATPTLLPEDLRFKTWNDRELPQSKAAVFAMMDTSGSMGTFQKWMAREFFYWMVRFLKTRYPYVETVFLAHHTEARSEEHTSVLQSR